MRQSLVCSIRLYGKSRYDLYMNDSKEVVLNPRRKKGKKERKTRSCYNVFFREEIQRMKLKGREGGFVEYSKEIAKRWNELSSESKEVYGLKLKKQ